MTSLAEVQAAVDAAITHVQEGQYAAKPAADRLAAAQRELAAGG